MRASQGQREDVGVGGERTPFLGELRRGDVESGSRGFGGWCGHEAEGGRKKNKQSTVCLLPPTTTARRGSRSSLASSIYLLLSSPRPSFSLSRDSSGLLPSRSRRPTSPRGSQAVSCSPEASPPRPSRRPTRTPINFLNSLASSSPVLRLVETTLLPTPPSAAQGYHLHLEPQIPLEENPLRPPCPTPPNHRLLPPPPSHQHPDTQRSPSCEAPAR